MGLACSLPAGPALLPVLSGLVGCASTPMATDGRLIDVSTGEPMDEARLLQRLSAADVVLLGEYHDNPRHHAWRARVITALSGGPTSTSTTRPAPLIVAEHLEGPLLEPPTVRWSTDPMSAPALLKDLEAAGFNARAWQWPLHQPLFEALARQGLTLEAGNLPRDEVRSVAREGLRAAPDTLQALLSAAPLTLEAQTRLDEDLVDGHCGQLKGERLTRMRDAQRARDASMALHILNRRAEQPGRPVVLLAGNGHVRHDYGVPVLLRAHSPTLKALSVGLLEAHDLKTPTAVRQMPYDLVFVAPDVTRDDPCAAMR